MSLTQKCHGPLYVKGEIAGCSFRAGEIGCFDGVTRSEWIWDLGMADAVVELTFDRPAFTLRTVSRVETFTLDLISAYAVRPCERWKKDIVGRDMASTAGFCEQEMLRVCYDLHWSPGTQSENTSARAIEEGTLGEHARQWKHKRYVTTGWRKMVE